MSKTVYILNGPNLNLLGQRQPEIYGRETLAEIEARCQVIAQKNGLVLIFRQTNREYEMVEWLQEARKSAGIAINPAGFSYHAVPVLDALLICECPIVEVHISNIHRREAEWRADTIMTAAATGIISGLGTRGYDLALTYLAERIAA